MDDMKRVIATLDIPAGMWVATSDDFPGLVAKAPSLKELKERLNELLPEFTAGRAEMVAVEIDLVSKRDENKD